MCPRGQGSGVYPETVGGTVSEDMRLRVEWEVWRLGCGNCDNSLMLGQEPDEEKAREFLSRTRRLGPAALVRVTREVVSGESTPGGGPDV